MELEDKIIQTINKYQTTNIDWLIDFYGMDIKLLDPMDVHKLAKKIVELKLNLPNDKEIKGEAMTYSSYPAMPDGHPEFEPARATDFDAGAKWIIEEIKKRNKL